MERRSINKSTLLTNKHTHTCTHFGYNGNNTHIDPNSSVAVCRIAFKFNFTFIETWTQARMGWQIGPLVTILHARTHSLTHARIYSISEFLPLAYIFHHEFNVSIVLKKHLYKRHFCTTSATTTTVALSLRHFTTHAISHLDAIPN